MRPSVGLARFRARTFSSSQVTCTSSPLFALSIAVALPVALWTYKCMMLVVFQRKIIYMGYVPPGARTETIEDVPTSHLRGLHCEAITIHGEKSVRLAGLWIRRQAHSAVSKIVMMYLQGNAGNPLHRLPVFQKLLESTVRDPCPSHSEFAILAVAPRSYWSSSSCTPSERGIISDYTHALRYALHRFPDANIILYGHSLGGAAAVCLLSTLQDSEEYRPIMGLILENPFASIPGMVQALYPVPYRYLAPLAIDKWDAVQAMQLASSPSQDPSALTRLSKDMLVMLSEKDEIVPNEMGRTIFNAACGDGTRTNIVLQDALHENAWEQRQWFNEVTGYIAACSKKKATACVD